MVDPVVASKICTFLCFNVVYLISAAWFLLHAFVFHLIKSEATFELSSAFHALIFLNCLIAFFVFLLSIFGFVAFCTDKPRLFQTVGSFEWLQITQFLIMTDNSTGLLTRLSFSVKYAILLLAVLVLQVVNEFLVDRANNELIVKSLKQNLPKFEFVLSSLQFEIQATQQKVAPKRF